MKDTFKLTIEAYGMTTSVVFDHDDVIADEVLNAFKGLMVAVGFGHETIDDCLKD